MLPASSDTGAPTVLGKRYEILASLGSGSAANVFKVHDRRSGELRAAKVLRPENAAIPEILARFEDEFRILRTLHHPHLPAIYDYGWTDDGGRYLVMELVEGEALDEYFHAHPEDIWVILYQLCEALTFVHSKNLLHQDIKPSNILVTRTSAYGSEMPLVKLIDFGLTYRRDTGAAVQLVGTPEYVAPEVVQGEASLTRAVDYYSLGASLYELLCGRPPFTGTTTEVLRAQVERAPVIDEEQLRWAELYPHVRALLTKDRKARLEAFEEFRRAIVSRLTGGIEELDRAYGLARIESLPMIGKEEVWKELMGWLEGIGTPGAPSLMVVEGERKSGKSYLVGAMCAEAAIVGIAIWRLGESSDVPWLLQRTGMNEESKPLQAARLWSVLREQAMDESIILCIDEASRLTPLEALIIHTIGSRWLLAEERIRSRLGFLLVGTPEPTARDLELALPVESRIAGRINALGNSDLDVVVGTFRGTMDTRDTRLLTSWLVRATESGVVIQGLAAANARDLICYSGQRWRVIPGLQALSLEQEWVRRPLETITVFISNEIRVIRDLRGRGEYQEIEAHCRDALMRLSTAGTHRTSNLFDYFLKRQVEALFARNLHVRMYSAIQDWLTKTNRKLPSNVIPLYVRAMMDARGPALALRYLAKQEPRFVQTTVLRARLLLEKALCLYNVGDYDASMACLELIGPGAGLSANERARSILYRVMCLHARGRTDAAATLLEDASQFAFESNCFDEYILGQVLRAVFVLNRGLPDLSLKVVARALPIANRHQLTLRHYHLLMLASSSYVERGEYDRAARCRERMITLASVLGNRDLVAGSWTKLAQYSGHRGYFGNALRYVRRARSVLEGSATAQDRSRLCYTEMTLHIGLMTGDVRNVVRRCKRVMRGVQHASDQGHYNLLMGDYFANTGDPAGASKHYEKARTFFESVAQDDDCVRAAAKECRVAIEGGDRKRVVRLRRYIEARAASIDSADVRTHVKLTCLLDHIARRTDKGVSQYLQESAEDNRADYGTQLRLRKARFVVHARRGNVPAALGAANLYFELVRRALSNLAEEDVARAFLESSGIDALSREVELVQRAGDHTAQGVIAGSCSH